MVVTNAHDALCPPAELHLPKGVAIAPACSRHPTAFWRSSLCDDSLPCPECFLELAGGDRNARIARPTIPVMDALRLLMERKIPPSREWGLVSLGAVVPDFTAMTDGKEWHSAKCADVPVEVLAWRLVSERPEG